jgi:hypothetical protein
VLAVAAVQGVALVHNLGEHGPALGVGLYVFLAALAVGIPAHGQRHDGLRVLVELTVTL